MRAATFSKALVKGALVATIAAAAMLAAGHVRADFDAGLAAAERGDYATAFSELLPLANQGHSAAQYNVGYMHLKGFGVPQDYAEAAKWFRKSAGKTYARAQNELGHLFRKGLGVPRDNAEAAEWYRKAAEQGDAGGSEQSRPHVLQRLGRNQRPRAGGEVVR